jgi:hypothetical protein
VWRLLKRNIVEGEWKAAILNQGLIASCYHCKRTDSEEIELEQEETSDKYHTIITNAFEYIEQDAQDTLPLSSNSDQVDPMLPLYPLKSLEKMKVEELKEILRKHKRKVSGNKSELINRINTYINPNPNLDMQVQRIENTISKISFKGIGKPHQSYKDHFNYVDKFNKFWYTFYARFNAPHWKVKLLICILRVGVCNAYHY